jgi:hypothetical protein
MLLFHEHYGGMRGGAHMTAMARIQAEHLSVAATGFGIAVFQGFPRYPLAGR